MQTVPRRSKETTEDPRGIADINPRGNTPPGRFQRLVDNYPDKEATSIYVYRTFPLIDRRLTGHEHKHLEILTYDPPAEAPAGTPPTPYPVLQEHLTKRWGGGNYRLFFKDKKLGGHNDVAQAVFEVDDTEHPPILDPAELIRGKPKNEQYISRMLGLGLYAKDGESIVMAGQERQQSQAPITTGDLLDLVREKDERSTTHMVLSKALDVMVNRNAAAAAAPAASSPADPMAYFAPMMTTFLQGQQQQQQFMFTMLERISANAAPPAPPPDPLKIASEIREQARELAQELSGRPAQSDGFDWSKLLATLAPVAMAMATRLMQQPAAAGAPPALPPAGAPLGAPPAPAEPFAPAGAVSADQMAAMGAATTLNGQAVTETAGQILAAINQGRTGDQFAEAFETLRGAVAYETLRQLGAEQLLELLLATQYGPHFEQIRPAAQKFLADFIEYGAMDPAAAGGV
ncbi:MAG: hypothetical protein CUN53_00090 [Phototrophicales bacterium]|nr:MAG: hypothetical protein CUN53_00090 [Phototrophicales bacterium]